MSSVIVVERSMLRLKGDVPRGGAPSSLSFVKTACRTYCPIVAPQESAARGEEETPALRFAHRVRRAPRRRYPATCPEPPTIRTFAHGFIEHNPRRTHPRPSRQAGAFTPPMGRFRGRPVVLGDVYSTNVDGRELAPRSSVPRVSS